MASGEIDVPGLIPSNCRKMYLRVEELVLTERRYVEALRLLNTEYREVCEKHLPYETACYILRHLDEVTRVSENLLEQLEIKFKTWLKDQRIASVFMIDGHTLKVYGQYLWGIEGSKETHTHSRRKYPRFNAAMERFEQEHCKGFGIQFLQSKLEQRYVKYPLFLTEYLKEMPIGHPDTADTIAALRVTRSVNEKVNSMVNKEKPACDLIRIQNSLIQNDCLIKPGRELLEMGEMYVVSNDCEKLRTFVLCSDVLIYLEEVQNRLYHLHDKISLTRMKVEMDYDDTSRDLAIKTPKISLDLRAENVIRKNKWFKLLTKAICEHNERRMAFVLMQDTQKRGYVLGEKEPVWTPYSVVNQCPICDTTFSFFTWKRYCRACGRLVCASCSPGTAVLKYCGDDKKVRVCNQCVKILTKRGNCVEKRASQVSVASTIDTGFGSVNDVNIPGPSNRL